MSYQQSRYVPLFEALGQPKRPYNRVQKLGTVLITASVVWLLLDLAGRAGLTPRWTDEFWPFWVLYLIGNLLLYSRRADYVPPDDAQRRRDMLRWVAAALLFVCVTIILFAFPGDR